MNLKLHSFFPDEIKTRWESLLDESSTNVPFLRFDYLKHWWQTRGGGEWPMDSQLAIVTASQNNNLTGIAPFFLHTDSEHTTMYLLGSKEICDYLDLIVRSKDLPAFVSELMNFIISPSFPQWDRLILFNLIESSPTIQALKDTAEKMGWGYKSECTQHSPFILLPGDWETYLASLEKKQRHEIRRKLRRTDENTNVRWYFVENAETLDKEIDAFFQLMVLDDEKAHFLTKPMSEQMRQTIHWAFRENCLQLSFLEIFNQKAASYLCFDYLNKIWVYNSGFDPRFSEYSPGLVLLGNLLEWANENHRIEFDFMRGNEDYKYRFGAQDRFIQCVIIQR